MSMPNHKPNGGPAMSNPEPDVKPVTEEDNAGKKAHHNALERRRRDHMKDCFNSLREAIPSLKDEKGASRVSILKETIEYVDTIRNENAEYIRRIERSKFRTMLLEAQLKKLIELQQNGLANGKPDDS